jgi:hypothetical protein
MPENRGLVCQGPGNVKVESTPFPKFNIHGKKIEHRVILRFVSTNI